MSKKQDRSDIDLSFHPLAPQDPELPSSSAVRARFSGFIGPSEEEDHVRIYTDLSFSSYFLVARNDVLSAAPSDELDANSPTNVIVQGSAHVAFIRTERLEGAASYVTGAIRRQFLEETDSGSLFDESDHPTTFPCATEPPKCTGPIFCPPIVLTA
jgi:hypothetical protein